MTSRGARLVLAVAGLAWGAAWLAFLAPALPEGLAAACAPGPVAREVMAGLAVAALLLGPAFVADEPGRPREDHSGLLAALAAAPAALALVLAGGAPASVLLPPAVVVLSCDLAASSWLRLDPRGQGTTAFAASAVALLAGLPIVAWGLADLGGWEPASLAFRFSPLLAAREFASGWPAAAPSCLCLLAASTALRLASLRAVAAAAAVSILVSAGWPSARAVAPPLPDHGPILLVGGVREGPVADLAAALGRKGLAASAADGLPPALPCEVEVVLFGRGPRDEGEEGAWRGTLRGFLRAGGRACAAPGPAADMLAREAEPGILGLVVALPDAGAVPAAADLLSAPRACLPHPASGPGQGLSPALFRVPFPVPPRALPGRTLAYLGILALAFAATALIARRRGFGQGRAALALGSLSMVGCALLFLPGFAAGEALETRLVLEERTGPDAVTARRLEIVRVERTRAGEAMVAVALSPAASWGEVRIDESAGGTFVPGEGLRLAGPGRYGILVGVSGAEAAPLPGPPLKSLLLRSGEPLGPALEGLRRDGDPRVALAAEVLRGVLRPLPGGGNLRVLVSADGPLAIVIHQAD